MDCRPTVLKILSFLLSLGTLSASADFCLGQALQERINFAGYNEPVKSIALSPDGKLLAAGGDNKVIAVLDLTSGTKKTDLEGHSCSVRWLAFAGDDKTLVSKSSREIIIWDLAKNKHKTALRGWKGDGLAVTPDGKLLASPRNGRDVVLWNLSAAKEESVLTVPAGNIASLTIDDTATRIAAGYDRRIRVWDLKDKELICDFEAHLASVQQLTFTSGGKTLVSVDKDGIYKTWEGRHLRNRDAFQHYYRYGFAIAPNGKLLATGTAYGRISFRDLETGERTDTKTSHRCPIMCVAFSPDGKLMASAAGRVAVTGPGPLPPGTIKIWDFMSGR